MLWTIRTSRARRPPEAVSSAEGTRGDTVEELRRQVEEKQDRLLRALAETENIRRRSQRDREDYVRYANESLLRDLVPVLDNLDRALGAARATNDASAVVGGRRADPARAAQGAGAGGRHPLLGARPALRSDPARGDRPGRQRRRQAGHRRRRDAAGLHAAQRVLRACAGGRRRPRRTRTPSPVAGRDYYEVLGVSRDAERDRDQEVLPPARHAVPPGPQPGDNKDAEEQFKEVNEAYAVLSDPDKRAQYDRFGTVGGCGPGFERRASAPSSRTSSRTSSPEASAAGAARGRARRGSPVRDEADPRGGRRRASRRRSRSRARRRASAATGSGQRAGNPARDLRHLPRRAARSG